MGANQSIYEKPGTLDYYRFSAEEYALVKKGWSGIEINPQYHGTAYFRSFCETYPQYAKFFTSELNLLNLDALTTSKFSVIMETMAYLLLDFNDRPKRLDRFVGYIAMVHKDMRLDEQDMCNLVTSLFEYLSRTYPAQMTSQCREAVSRFMDSIIKQLSIKMEAFRRYDEEQSDSTARLPCGQCPFFAEPMIFGKTKLYWDEWKKQWDEQLNEWMVQATSFVEETPAPISVSPNDEDSRIKFDNENSMLERQASVQKRRVSDVSASKFSADASMPRRRLRSSRMAAVDRSALKTTADDEETTKRFDHESPKTARERRRERLKINLE